MKKNKRKISFKKIALLGILLLCTYIVLHDLYMLTIYSWITKTMVGWTWFGFTTFIVAFAVGGEIVEYFIEEINK